jgi:hypothetical protein
VPRGIELDWVVVHVNTLRRAAAIVAIGVVATALVALAYLRLNLPPDAEARRAIERAEASHEKVVNQSVPDAWVQEFEQAESQLDAARRDYADEHWESANRQASDARMRFEGLLGAGRHELVGVGRFFILEGRVSVQRAGKAEWISAHETMPVFNGDFVKTGRDGSAEILFADGSMYRIAPNSLLEIHHRRQSASSSPGTVKMVVGRVNVVTSDSGSTVSTETTQTQVDRDSRVAFDVGEDRQRTTVATYSGRARVRNPTGQEVVVTTQETVAARSDGSFTEKRALPRPPQLISPLNNSGFGLERNTQVELVWQRRSEDDRAHLQVSRSQRFLESRLDIDRENLLQNRARLKVVNPGTYYWRIATIDTDDLRSEWSTVRRFQVLAPTRHELIRDTTAPELTIDLVQQLGHLFIVEGRTEIGAAVSINGETVEIGAQGSFRKTVEVRQVGWNELVVAAVDPSGNATERRKRVFVEDY